MDLFIQVLISRLTRQTGKEIYNKDNTINAEVFVFPSSSTQILVLLMEFEVPWVRQEVISIQVD